MVMLQLCVVQYKDSLLRTLLLIIHKSDETITLRWLLTTPVWLPDLNIELGVGLHILPKNGICIQKWLLIQPPTGAQQIYLILKYW
jgi:hypothetical protein